MPIIIKAYYTEHEKKGLYTIVEETKPNFTQTFEYLNLFILETVKGYFVKGLIRWKQFLGKNRPHSRIEIATFDPLL